MTDMAQTLAEQKSMILEVQTTLSTMLEYMIPNETSITDLARSLQKDTSTITKYIKNHFEPNKDYYQDKKGGKIYVRREAMMQTRMHYGK